jgi:AcrR family transcriptional regulator
MTAAEVPPRRERPGKAAILRAAVEVMGREGYEGASLRDMAAQAGVSVAALYYHFPSKNDLLREFVEEAYAVVLARIRRRLDAVGESPADRLDDVVGTLVASVVHDEFARLAANVAWREHTRLDPPGRKAVDAKRAELLDLVTEVIEAGVADGAFVAEEPREAARSIITLATTAGESFEDVGRTMPAAIRLYQGFARSLAGAR